MNTQATPGFDEGELLTAEADSTIALLNKSEIDIQIATAKRYPRSIKRFRDECLSMVTLSPAVATQCIYALPRGKDDNGQAKTIEGPSARFAEVVASAWGNNRAAARVIAEEGDFVTAQGAFFDLERNAAITYEVKRRIVDKRGNRFSVDMIGVTANAACSIALRNAILKGVPKAFWADMYDAARKTVVGDIRSISEKRVNAVAEFQKMGATPEQVFRAIGVNGIEDIGVDQLVTLLGMFTALRDGDATFEQVFSASNDTGGLPANLKRTAPVPQPAEPAANGHAEARKPTEPVQQKLAEQPPAADRMITEQEGRKFYAKWNQAGKSKEDVRAYLTKLIGSGDDRKMPLSRFAEACAWADAKGGE